MLDFPRFKIVLLEENNSAQVRIGHDQRTLPLLAVLLQSIQKFGPESRLLLQLNYAEEPQLSKMFLVKHLEGEPAKNFSVLCLHHDRSEVWVLHFFVEVKNSHVRQVLSVHLGELEQPVINEFLLSACVSSVLDGLKRESCICRLHTK